MIVAIFIICFKKTLTKGQKVVHNVQTKERRKCVGNLSKTIILNDTDFEKEEPFLLDQSTLSTLTYSPSKDLISNHRKGISSLLCDLNSEPTKPKVRDFCQIYRCKNLNKDNTCFKNPEKPSCIDLIITNRRK